ncbi:N-acetyltransferase [Roseibium aquae]|uniref:N-acetyltransferase n=1 Tax=Roseibium aquae TaxID=1323746 RepID=A0A916TLL6_9HYPH|nr:N-acetyltransferase [Roseibium aquae]GGB57239.1 N-acetyltransferase [Roseibium aquae]
MPHSPLLDGLSVRPFESADKDHVRDIIVAAFGQEAEANLVRKLRHCGALVLEQVAVGEDGAILGHIAFSRATPAAIGAGQGLHVTCLAPMSVRPAYQKQGIGGALIHSSLARLRETGEDLVLVLGPPTYYPRFGFDAELATKISGPYAGAAFMAMALTEAGKRDLPIEVAFPTPFEEFE